MTLNKDDRILERVQCTGMLKPFDFVFHNAGPLRAARSNYRVAKQNLSELYDRFEAVKREEKRLCGRNARLKAQRGIGLNVPGNDSP